MSASTPRFLLVIPAYRESARLPDYLEELVSTLADARPGITIQIVDDGSGPGEQAALLGLVTRHANSMQPSVLEPLCLPDNQGKGAAVRIGWTEGLRREAADWVGFVDADGAIPAIEVRRLIEIAASRANPEVLFASRIRMLGRRVERSAMRHLSGRLFATLIGNTICSEVYDSQCGFKLLPREAWQHIADELQEPGFAFDVELLAALRKSGLAIEEVPIDWIDRPGSKVRLLRDGWRMVRAVFRIKRRFSG